MQNGTAQRFKSFLVSNIFSTWKVSVKLKCVFLYAVEQFTSTYHSLSLHRVKLIEAESFASYCKVDGNEIISADIFPKNETVLQITCLTLYN